MKKKIHIILYFITGLIICIGCKEETGLIGIGDQPDGEFLNTNYFDTTTLIAYSTIHDSLITSNVSTNMLGYIHDPVFGKTQAGIYTQFRLSSFSANFGNNVVVDSLVLTLAYAGYYGDTLNSFRLNVYELTDNLTKNKAYYSKSFINYDNNSLTEVSNLYITPTPTVKQDTLASSYYLRIRLKTDFAKSKFISKSGSSVYSSDAAFLEHFKGLYLEADNPTGNGCMLSVNMTHSLSGLTIYYSNDQAKNLKYTFNLNDSTVHFGVTNHFDYVDATPNLREQLNGNYTSAKEILYGQSGSGIKVTLNFPYLRETFKDKKVAICRALLVVSHQDDALPNYLPPSALIMTYTDINTGTGYLLPDYYLGLGSDYFGGTYNQTSKEYRFNITKYIQDIVDGTSENYPLNLLVNPSVTHLSRLMIYGTHPVSVNDYDKRLQLRINYTIIDK
ncbi:MAG: DUF4270 domain-containing protein [Bacteroidales bacterium]|nr:DUF4270 domain-containing protein [Bacteroidales bacterium]